MLIRQLKQNDQQQNKRQVITFINDQQINYIQKLPFIGFHPLINYYSLSMSIKYSVLNVSYDQTTTPTTYQNKYFRSISRYSDYTRRNKIKQQNPQDKKQTKSPSDKSTDKLSFYQQYKNRQFLKKRKISNNTLNHHTINHHFGGVYLGSTTRNKIKTDNQKQTKQQHLLLPPDIQTVHSQYKPQTPNIRRRFSMSLNSQRLSSSKQNQQKKESKTKGIGIFGIKTSFLDKYKLKNNFQEQEQDDIHDKQFKRRQILCSTKRNKSIEPRSFRTSQSKRNKYPNGYNIQTINLNDRIQCRPWSPNKDQDFQRI